MPPAPWPSDKEKFSEGNKPRDNVFVCVVHSRNWGKGLKYGRQRS